MNALVWICRILVGALFIVSGMIKANDPIGFSYKLEEYFAESALNLPALAPWALILGIVACMAEIVLGFALIVGGRMKLTSWLLMLLIVFFGWLTFYTATCDPAATYTALDNEKEVQRAVTCVTDCGCFGDAMKGSIGRSLTPWESFTKDAILFVLLLPVMFYNRKIKFNTLREDALALPAAMLSIGFFAWIFTWYFPFVFFIAVSLAYLLIKKLVSPEKSEWSTAGMVALFSGIFAWYCYAHLPMRDYRPFAIGKSITEGMAIPPGAKTDVYKTVLVYEKNGVSKEFTTENYPWQDTTWVWKETKNTLVEKGYEPPIHDFSLMSPDGVDDTKKILEDDGYTFILVAYNVGKTNREVQPLINAFAAAAEKDSVRFIGLTNSLHEQTEAFRHEVQAAYPYYSGDEKVLKTMIRSNPGLMLIKKGVVVDMWHYNDFPDYGEVKAKYGIK